MSEPATKKQKTDETQVENPTEDPAVQGVLEDVQKIDEELEADNMQLSKEVLALEAKHNLNKRPLFVKRLELLRQVPGFWKQTLVNHPLLVHFIDEQDEEIMAYLKEVDVTFTDKRGGFKIDLVMDKNPFLTNEKLWKEITYAEDGELEVEVSPIEWTEEGRKLQEKDAESPSFFNWFASEEGDQIASEVFKDDIWKDPVQFYLNKALENVDTEDEEEDEEDEEEEADGEKDTEEEAGGEEENGEGDE